MADTSPACALDQVRWIEAMCDIIEDADVQSIIITKMVPVSTSMPLSKYQSGLG